jgi:Ca2+-transporting ATPase
MKFYQEIVKNVVNKLGSDIQNGLKTPQVKQKQQKYGFNILTQEQKISAWKVFFSQFKSFLILILIAAAVVSILV